MKLKSSRKLWIVMLAITCLVIAPAFAQGGKDQSTDSGVVTITVWDWLYGSEGSQGEIAKALDKAFEAAHPNIKVNHETVPHPPYDVYAASIAAKRGADVLLIHANGQNFQDMAPSLVVLDPYISDMMDQFPQSTLADTAPDRDISKGVRGLPISVQGWVWYYNKTLFEKAGLDPENPPTTWSELLDVSEKLAAAGITPIAFGEGIHLEMMIAGTLDQVLSTNQKRDLLSGNLSFTDPQILDVFNRFRELFAKGYMDRAGLTTPLLRQTGERFMAGNSAIFRGFVSDIFNWYEFGNALGGENVGVIPNFYIDGSAHRDVVGAAGGIAYAVPLYSDKKDAAVEYIKFAASKTGADITLSAGGTMPANITADTSLIANDTGRVVASLLADSIVPPTKAFITSSQWNALRLHAPLLITGDISALEYAKRIDAAR